MASLTVCGRRPSTLNGALAGRALPLLRGGIKKAQLVRLGGWRGVELQLEPGVAGSGVNACSRWIL